MASNAENVSIWWRHHGTCSAYVIIAGQTNLALFRPATQSSTYDANEANRAVDGDISSAALTGGGIRHPWWKVQLAYPVWVTRVEIIGVIHKGKREREGGTLKG